MSGNNAVKQANQKQKTSSNDVPTLSDGGDDQGDGGDDSGGLPVPSMSKKHAAIIGGIAVVIIAWKLYKMSDGQHSNELAQAASQDFESEASVDDDDGDQPEIRVPTASTSDPLAGDEAVTEEFRKRGVLGESEG